MPAVRLLEAPGGVVRWLRFARMQVVVRRLGMAVAWGASVIATGSVMTACTDVGLYRQPGLGEGPIDNKLAVQSSFCTVDPLTLAFPVKILFVVDTSQSMVRTDPTGRRVTAVNDVIDAFIGDPGVEFGIVQFSGAANILTNDEVTGDPGFTRNLTDLQTAIVRLGLAEQPTDYEGALNAVFTVLTRDMEHSKDTDEAELARAKYVVIFLSDGLPNPVLPPNNTRSSILARVDDILELRRIFRPADIKLHTALVLGALGTGYRCTDSGLEGGNVSCQSLTTAAECAAATGCVFVGVQPEAESLLSAMAEGGNGTYRSFPNGEEINFLKIDFTSIRRVFTVKNLIVTNTNARPRLLFLSDKDRIGRASPDSDGDGLDDEEEALYGTLADSSDSDGDGFNDFLEVRLAASGFDPLDPTDADCELDIDRVDSDGDGLRDCEERFVGTSRNFMDSDADGVPDMIELRYGTNPSAGDGRSDLDFDSARNADEIRGHSDPVVNDAANRSSIAYRYDLKSRSLDDLPTDDERVALVKKGRSCYDFSVENITLASTDPGGENRIFIYVDQAPFDDPSDFGTFRVACVKQVFIHPDFRDPPFPIVRVPSDAFREPTDFDPDRDCVVGVPSQ